MGVDPYLIAPTLKLAIAQRLARRICPPGKQIPVDNSMKMMFDKEFETLPEKYRDRIPAFDHVLEAEASPSCASGTKGRIAVMEVLEINQQIQDLILKGGTEEQIYKVARANGFMSMKEDAIIKSLQGQIPYKEVNDFGTKVGAELSVSDEFLASDTATNIPENLVPVEMSEGAEKGEAAKNEVPVPPRMDVPAAPTTPQPTAQAGAEDPKYTI